MSSTRRVTGLRRQHPQCQQPANGDRDFPVLPQALQPVLVPVLTQALDQTLLLPVLVLPQALDQTLLLPVLALHPTWLLRVLVLPELQTLLLPVLALHPTQRVHGCRNLREHRVLQGLRRAGLHRLERH